MSRATLFVLLAAPAALLVACGSDGTAGTTGTAAGAGGSTSATSAAGTGGTGGTGGESTTAAAGTGGGAASTTTSSGTTATTGATGSTGTGAMMMGACTNAGDQAILMSKDIPKITEDCASSSFGAEPATKNCIKTGTGFSDPCVTCFDDNVGCVIKHCVFQCSSDSGSPDCVSCRATNCDPAFVACSGLPAN